MPYWTSSRVGPIVGGDIHNTSSKKKKKKDEAITTHSNTASSRRGITMEDLKKQTALRLAQEQQPPPSSMGAAAAVEESKVVGSEPPLQDQPRSNPSEETFSYSTTTSTTTLSDDVGTEHGTTVVATPPPPSSSSTSHRLFRSSSHTKSHRAVEVENVSVTEKKYTTPTKSGFFFSRGGGGSPQTQAPSSASPMKQHPSSSSRSLFFTSTSSSSHGRNHHHPSTTNLNSTNAMMNNTISSTVIASRTAIDTSTATEKGTNAKLPHGLTVSELKQMTKARLQAEATTSSSTHSAPDANSNSSLMMMNEHHLHHHPHVNPTYMNTTDPSPTRRSPYPMIYDTTSDTWETASVSTTCTSEFLYPMINTESTTHHNINDVSIPFVRTLSYPNQTNSNSTSPHPKHPPPPLVAPVAMENHHHFGTTTTMYHPHPPPTSNLVNTATNRSHALTSSPRLGMSSTLSAAYHPVYNNTEDNYPYHSNYPTMHHSNSHPNAVSSVHETLPYSQDYIMTPDSMFTDPDVLPNYYPGTGTLGHGNYDHNNMTGNNKSFVYESNRCRTSSLPSVLLPKAEEDPIRNNSDFGNILRHPSNQLTAVNEQIPSSLDKSNVFVAGLSDAFQSPQVSSFPSFYSGDNHNAIFTSLDDGFGIGGNDSLPPTRYRASTWADATTSSSSNKNGSTTEASSLFLFGNVGSRTATTDSTDLSDDLASILKLSTASSLSSQHPMDHHHVRSTNATNNTTTDDRSTTLF